MASRSFISMEKVDSYNIPLYAPCWEEVREIVELEGSLRVMRSQSYEVITDGGDGTGNDATAGSAAMAKTMRAVHEAMVVSHFGVLDIGDEFEKTLEERGREMIGKERLKFVVPIFSLKKKQPGPDEAPQ